MGVLVLFDVQMHGEHAHQLGGDEGESPRVEGPAVAVVALALLILPVTGVARIAGDEDDDADDVAQACGGGGHGRRRGVQNTVEVVNVMGPTVQVIRTG